MENSLRPNLTKNLTKFRVAKNLIVISASFLFIYTGDEGLIVLQTTLNKAEGLGTATLAVAMATFGLTSLFFTSFAVKKFGSKNAQFFGFIMMLPFIVSNVYPKWITMLPSAVLRGIGISLLWSAQCTYFNESAVLFHKVNKRKFQYSCSKSEKYEHSDIHKESRIFKSKEQNVEQLSASDLLNKAENNSVPNEKSFVYPSDSTSVRLTACRYMKDGLTEDVSFSKEKNKKIPKEIKDSVISKTINDISGERKNEELMKSSQFENTVTEKTEKKQSTIDSTKALFFGIHGFVYNSATVFSSLISYYVLQTGSKENYNKTSISTCGARFCSANKYDSNNSIEEVATDTRYLLIGVYTACAIVAPLLLLLVLDRLAKTTESVKLSLDHVFATVKYIKKKDQLLLIPFTIGANICRGFYMADFTKSYIACAWSISHIGLITIINGTTSALSSISSGLLIKCVGRRIVLVIFQIITITNFVFLLFWIPNAQQKYLFYIQGCIFGMMAGIFNSQTRALYGIFFEGDEATAFSSCNMYTSIGWTLPFIYNDFFCVSVKIYIVLAFSVTGLIGYLLAERSYRLRVKQKDSSK